MDKTFLLVDDDSDDADLFREALGEIDPSVACYCASDGEDALDKLQEKEIREPDIIFLDINMPRMNGWQCLSKLKHTDAFKDIPVVMYSTSSHNIDTKTASDLGALCFFSKPNDFIHLKKILEIVVFYMGSGSLKFMCKAVHNLKF